MHEQNANTEVSKRQIGSEERWSGMIAAKPGNPHFKNISRAPYELGFLLKAFHPGSNQYEKQADDTYLIAEAAGMHAANGINALMHGLAALGAVMVAAGGNEETSISQSTVIALGGLIEHISIEIQLLYEMEYTMDEIAESRNQHVGKKGGA